jgi:hypothetical protein
MLVEVLEKKTLLSGKEKCCGKMTQTKQTKLMNRTKTQIRCPSWSFQTTRSAERVPESRLGQEEGYQMEQPERCSRH